MKNLFVLLMVSLFFNACASTKEVSSRIPQSERNNVKTVCFVESVGTRIFWLDLTKAPASVTFSKNQQAEVPSDRTSNYNSNFVGIAYLGNDQLKFTKLYEQAKISIDNKIDVDYRESGFDIGYFDAKITLSADTESKAKCEAIFP